MQTDDMEQDIANPYESTQNVSIMLPSLKSWQQSRLQSKMMHCMIPMKITDDINKGTALMLLMEQCTLEEMQISRRYLSRDFLPEDLLNKWNNFIESSLSFMGALPGV